MKPSEAQPRPSVPLSSWRLITFEHGVASLYESLQPPGPKCLRKVKSQAAWGSFGLRQEFTARAGGGLVVLPEGPWSAYFPEAHAAIRLQSAKALPGVLLPQVNASELMSIAPEVHVGSARGTRRAGSGTTVFHV